MEHRVLFKPPPEFTDLHKFMSASQREVWELLKEHQRKQDSLVFNSLSELATLEATNPRTVWTPHRPKRVEDIMPQEVSVVGQGYPPNSIFQVAIIEDPPVTLDPSEQKPPRLVLAPTPFLAPSPQIALIMAAQSGSMLKDADLQRCRVQITQA